MGEFWRTYDGDDTVVFQEVAQIVEEFDGEKLGWLGASGEDVVDDVVVLGRGGCLCFLDEVGCVLDGGNVVWWKVEVLSCEFVHNWVNLNDGGLDAVLHQSSWGSPDSKTAVLR